MPTAITCKCGREMDAIRLADGRKFLTCPDWYAGASTHERVEIKFALDAD